MKKNRHSFTLIEMLVVIVIIGILIGMLFRLMQGANRAKERAACITTIERVSFALNEFKAEYGQYPPGGGGSKSWYPGNMPDLLRDNYFKKYKDTGEKLYNYNYLSYLLPRKDGGFPENSQEINDTPRDTAAKKRWASFLDGIVGGGSVTNFIAQGQFYALDFQVIGDPWGNDLQYKCDPPYQIFDLYSVGPDGHEGVWNGKNDDIHKSQKWDD